MTNGIAGHGLLVGRPHLLSGSNGLRGGGRDGVATQTVAECCRRQKQTVRRCKGRCHCGGRCRHCNHTRRGHGPSRRLGRRHDDPLCGGPLLRLLTRRHTSQRRRRRCVLPLCPETSCNIRRDQNKLIGPPTWNNAKLQDSPIPTPIWNLQYAAQYPFHFG